MKKLVKAGLAIQSVLDTPSIKSILSSEDIEKLRAAKRVLVAGSDYDDNDYVVLPPQDSGNKPHTEPSDLRSESHTAARDEGAADRSPCCGWSNASTRTIAEPRDRPGPTLCVLSKGDNCVERDWYPLGEICLPERRLPSFARELAVLMSPEVPG